MDVRIVALILVASSSSCLVQTEPVEGPPGETGPVGKEGPPGKQGDVGSPGEGASGTPGAHCWDTVKVGGCDPGEDVNGDNTCTPADCLGPTGSQGPVGSQGPDGPQGPQGPIGSVGPSGPAGPLGPAGPQGPPGGGAAPLSVLAGEPIAAADGVYISSIDGKAYRTDAANPDEPVENFVGFSYATTPAGATVDIHTGPVADVFTGLLPGSVYYLSTNGSISSTPGSIFKPIGIAVESTSLYLFPTQSYRQRSYVGQLSIPTPGNNTDVVVPVGFRSKYIRAHGQMLICNSAGQMCQCMIFDSLWDGSTNAGANTIRTPSGSCQYPGNAGVNMSLGYDTTNPSVETSSNSNDSKLTLSVVSVTNRTLTFRLTNTIKTGSGSTNGGTCKLTALVTGG